MKDLRFRELGNRLMNAPSQFLFDGLQLCLHAIPPGLPFDLEFAPTSFAADKGEAQEGEGLRFAEPAPLRFSTAKRPNSISRVFSE